jgi:hypothetical protein
MIVVRTHGGLGNQLFQIGRALRLGAEAGTPVARIHDIRYKVVFPASPLFADLDAPVPAQLRALSFIRLPKLLNCAGLGCAQVRLGATRLLDGYFQAVNDWQGDVACLLHDFRARLGIVPCGDRGTLAHLRLGDFFADEAAQRSHLSDRLAALPAGATLISNRDDLLAPEAALLAARGFSHQPTADLSPEALLRLMASFQHIQSNDSTLAFWAALLGRAEMSFRLDRLQALFATLRAGDR